MIDMLVSVDNFILVFVLSELNVEEADAKRFFAVLRERLHELNHKEYGYILVANKLPAHYRGTAHLSFLQNIPWVAVFDLFDSSSKRDGLHHACNETSDAPRANIRTLDDFKEVTPDKDSFVSTRGTTWILSNEEMQKGDWIKCSKDCLYRALSAYKPCFPPGRLMCVFLCFSESAVNEMADIMESSFSILGNSAGSCVTIISESKHIAEAFIKASKPSLQKELAECSITGISWILLKEIIREMLGPSNFEEKGGTTELPYFTGQLKEVFNKTVHSWNDLEVYCPNPRLPTLAEAIEKERDEFYKGAQASQMNLLHNHSIPRSLEKEVTANLDRALKSLSKENADANYPMKTIAVSYEPGSGATTMCRRILWSKRNDYRCAVVKAISSSTEHQIDELQSIGYEKMKTIDFSPPVLVLVDNFPESDVRQLTEQIIKSQTKCVLLTTLPISKSVTNSKFEFTLGKLDEIETSMVKNILINITSDAERRREAEQVLDRERRFLWFGLELFGREYLKIKERLENHINSIVMAFLEDLREEHQMLLDVCCFLNKYSDGCVLLPHSVILDFLFETSSSAEQKYPDIKDVHEIFGGLLLEEQNQTNGYYGWRPAHSLVSEVVTSRMNVEETAIHYLERVCKAKAYAMKFLRQQVFRMFLHRKRISDPVFLDEQAIDDGAVGTDVDNEVFGFYGKRTRYSPVIVDILDKSNIEGALRVLLTICEQATQTEDKAYTWQQLARFMGYEMRANIMDEQDDLNKRLYNAMTKEGHVKLPMPINGIDAAHSAVDIAVSLQPSFTNHYNTKAGFYVLQLRDLKALQLRSLPEAIEICHKALGAYDKGLKASHGRNHFSMNGKIEAIISLLEIVKDLPCFQSGRKFMAYLKKEEVPAEIEEVLSKDEQDFVQSLSSRTFNLLNDLFGNVKFEQTTTYDENEIRSLNNAKIRASNMRRKFYEITGFDKSELIHEEYSMSLSPSTSAEFALYQQKVQDILFIHDETPFSTWSNLTDTEVKLIYQLMKSLCLRGRGSHNDMLICSKACLQLKDRPPVDELNEIVTIWVENFKDSEWAHLFYYMIHFPTPNGSLAPYNPSTKASIKKCGSIVREKAGSGFRKSGAEYFLGKGIGLHAIVSSQEFRWLETKWKTKTHFWRGKEPSERLQRVQGQKDLGSKGIISYQGIQLHFDNALYPSESKDDLWFYVGFTVAGPYAYDPVDNDTYDRLRRSVSLPTMSHISPQRSTPSDKLGNYSGNNGTRGKERLSKMTPWKPQEAVSVRERDVDENICDVGWENPDVFRNRSPHALNQTPAATDDISDTETGWITVGGRFGPLLDCAREPTQKESKPNGPALSQRKTDEWKRAKAPENRVEEERVINKRDNLKTAVGTRGAEKKLFHLKHEGRDGKLYYGAFVLGVKKSKECGIHNFGSDVRATDRCNFAHGWRGDTLQFVCTKCTEENLRYCKEKIDHESFIWNLGPYRNSRGEVWKDEVPREIGVALTNDPFMY